MKRGTLFIISILIGIVFIATSTGCISLQKRKYYRELAGTQKTQAQEWLHSGDLLYKLNDYELASDYYGKIIKYYPGTKYADEAQNKINEIKKINGSRQK